MFGHQKGSYIAANLITLKNPALTYPKVILWINTYPDSLEEMSIMK